MKNRIVLIVSLLGMLVCSCKKEDPQHLLIGTWEASASVSPQGNPAGALEVKGIVFTFEADGTGTFAIADVLDFTYQYIKESNTIRLQGEIDNTLYIDSLEKDSFIFHSTEPAQPGGTIGPQDWVFYGKKIK